MNVAVEKVQSVSSSHLEEIREKVKNNINLIEEIETDEDWEFSYTVFDMVECRLQRNIIRSVY